MITIRSNIGFPPGGLIYEDPRIQSAKWLDDHTWLEERTAEVIKFRAANPAIYPEADWVNPTFVKQQITDFNCLRWGNNPLYCIEATAFKSAPVVKEAARICPDCNVEIVPKYCPSCSGRRIIGYECPQCKKEYPK